MSQILYLNVGENAAAFYSSISVANPQIQFFENMPTKDGMSFHSLNSNGTLSIHAVNIPLSLSFNQIAVLLSASSAAASLYTGTIQFGLYSLNGSTLSLANSASANPTIITTALSWISMVTSATQNITPGAWYFALNALSGVGDHSLISFWGNTSINPGNSPPALIQGRMTVSTNAMPASIATSQLDISGADATRQPYIILTA